MWIRRLCRLSRFFGPRCSGQRGPRCSATVIESGPVAFDLREAGATFIPQFRNGKLILRHRGGASDPQYSIYDRKGSLAARFRIDLPGASDTLSTALAPAGGGYAAVAIGVNGLERVPVLCLLDSSGKLLSAVRTSPLWPVQIVSAADGSIWGFGAASPNDDPAGEEPVLFGFSASGKLLGTALPRRLFGSEPPFEFSLTGPGEAALATGGGRVVVYAPETRQLIEVALDDRRILASRVVPLPKAGLPGGSPSATMALLAIAVTESGTVFARLSGGEGTGIYELDRGVPQWVSLAGGASARFRDYSLIGSDGEDLVLCPAGPRGTTLPVTRVRITPRFPVRNPN